MFKRRWPRLAIAILVLAGVFTFIGFFFSYVQPRLNWSPYPKSSVITGITLDWTTHRHLAPGSGDWATTWADDDHQYTAWGNGGGFGGTDTDGRVYLGFARVEGPKDNCEAFNVWGGKDAENPAQFGGKSYGIISVDGTLYMWRCGETDGIGAFEFQDLYVSTDHSQTWSSTGVRFTQASFPGDDQGFECPVFLQFGKDNADARDDYIYVYATELNNDQGLFQKPGQISLVRVPKSSIADLDAYEYFAGLDDTNEPLWTPDVAQRRPVFEDPSGLSHPSALYNPGLDRYFLMMEHSYFARGNLALYDAPEPWGPWTTVVYTHDFGWPHISANGFMWVIPNKWLSEDGEEFVIILTGKDENDSWNTIEGRFIVSN